MPLDRIYKNAMVLKYKELICLIFILILSFIFNFYPHFNYDYLLHVDEWFHVAIAKQVVFGSEINWYSGDIFSLGLERAWHTTLAIIYFVFRPSIFQWIYFPTILHSLSVIIVYTFMSRLNGKIEGLISALLVAILPSNVTIGGPVFLAPINLSLIFIPLTLIFAFQLTKLKEKYNYILTILFTGFLLYAHPPSAIVLLLILGFYFLLNLFSKKNDCKNKAKYIFISIISSIIISLPNFLPEIGKRGLESVTFDFWVYLRGIPIIYGIIPTFFFIIGFYFISRSERKESWCFILTSILLILNVLFFTRFGLSYILPYQRTYIPLFLLMSLVGSFGFTSLLRIKFFNKKMGVFLVIICLIATMGLGIYNNINTPYYRLIDDSDYESFIWIKENTPEDSIVLADPYRSRTLATVAERRVYGVMPFGPEPDQLKRVSNTYYFFEGNCTDTYFLIQNNISVVYTRGNCLNPNLDQKIENVYILK